MKKFLISAAVIATIATVAVLVIGVSDCQRPDPGPDPDVTVRPVGPGPTASTSVPAPDAGPEAALAWVQTAESGTVRSVGSGRKSLRLRGVDPSLKLPDGSKEAKFPELEDELFGESGEAAAVLDYDSSLGPLEVKLSEPEVSEGTAYYVMEVSGGGQVLAELENPVLRIRPAGAPDPGRPVP